MSAECSLPTLTPECPFYDTTVAGDPACAEQCIDFIARFPQDQANALDVVLGSGLLAQRQGPKRREPDSDSAPFDAGQFMIEDAHRPLSDWRIVSLVGALLACVLTPNDSPAHGPDVLAELSRRGLDVEQLAPVLAFRRGMAIGLGISMYHDDQEELGRDFTAFPDEWRPIAMAETGDDDELLIRTDLTTKVLLGMGIEACVTDAVPTEEQIKAAATIDFPDKSLLADGSWFVDRFAATYIEHWTSGSRRREWEFIKGKRPGCAPPHFMRARMVASGPLAELVANDFCDTDPEKKRPRGTSPEQLARLAIDKVTAGEFEQAVALFRAAAALWPERLADIPNNLGFCLIPISPDEAVTTLNGAISHTGTPTLTRLNLALALHLVGDEDASLTELASVLQGPKPADGAHVWAPSEDAWTFVFVDDLMGYAEDVADHVVRCAGGCGSFRGSPQSD